MDSLDAGPGGDLMRILLVADVPPDPNAGAAGSEYQTLDALRELGHEVDPVWAEDLGPRRFAHGNLHYLLELPRAFRREVRRAFARKVYDVVRGNQPHGFLAAEWLARNHPRSVFVHRSHGLELRAERDLAPWRARHSDDDRSWPRRAASRALGSLLARHTHRMVRAAAGHEVYATECRDFLAAELCVPVKRVAVVAAAPPPARVATPAPRLTAGRLGTILYVSQFAFFKAPMIVAAAMNDIARTRSDVRFVWVCDAAHHSDVRALLAPEVLPRIDLLHWMPQDELRAVFDRCGIFLFPAFLEGFGKVFLEAMSRGLVVIATDIAGARDLIEHGRSGYLVPVGDADAITRRACAVLAAPDQAAKVGAAAAEVARTFTWERIASETIAFYRSLLKMQR